MNRLQEAIDRLEANHDQTKLEGLAAKLPLTFQEHFAYQEAQAHAFAGGILTEGEAMIAYRALGEVYNAGNGGWATHSPATKIVVTKLIGELAGIR